MVFAINGVPIEDEFCETFTVRVTRILITSVNAKWAYESAVEAKGLGRSATIPPCEATIEGEVKPEDSPDSRPGFIVQFMDRKSDSLKEWFVIRIRKGVIPYPKTSVFDVLPKELAIDWVDIKGTIIQAFGDGFERETEVSGRQVLQIPRMDGYFSVETRFGIAKGVAGGMFLIMARTDGDALEAAERAVDAVKAVPYVVGKFASSGTKVGGKRYKNAVATTNEAYCPALPRVEGSKVPVDVECIYEVIVSGLRMEDVSKAMKLGIEAATQVRGLVKISTANYGGTLGKGRIYLQKLFESQK